MYGTGAGPGNHNKTIKETYKIKMKKNNITLQEYKLAQLAIDEYEKEHK